MNIRKLILMNFIGGIIIGAILTGGLLLNVVHSAVTFKQAKEVWIQLQNVSGQYTLLHLDSDTRSNAYVNWYGRIFITQGMLNDLENKDQLAMVLGHEMAHLIKKHHLKKESSKWELEADKLGFSYCKKLKYTKCLRHLDNMLKIYGEEGYDGIHPSWSKRKQELLK